MSFDLDALIDDAVVYGELQDGTDATWLAQRVDPRRVALLAKIVPVQNVGKEREWTWEEDEFLVNHYMVMSDEELAQALGRTADGVHIHWERKLRLPARSRNPEWPNLHEVARLLGVPCSKVFRKLIDRGIVPGRKLPLGADVWVIYRRDLLRFACDPRNWVYFKVERVQDPQLRRLIELRRAMWGDAWWSPGEVAAYHGVSISVVNKYINLGKLPAVRWYNWHILRSDAVRFPFQTGKGTHCRLWTERGDAFLILGRALGFSWGDLDALTGLPHTDGRVTLLWKRRAVESIARRYELGVQVDPERRRLYADWRQWRGRFPVLERAVACFVAGQMLTETQARLILGLMTAWLDWHAQTPVQQEEARRLQFRVRTRTESVRRTYEQLAQWGFSLE